MGFLSFHPIFLIFGMNVHNYVGQKPVELEFRIFAYNFLWVFDYKKIGILEVFGHWLPQFSFDLSDI